MLLNDCRSACEVVGLDAQLGLLYAIRPGHVFEEVPGSSVCRALRVP
ncbi:MAG: hypothetical protein DMG20_07455 [Acidobacteria bacterium]|nr:MAG: hypothetical protein DMG20_07455 [Acidobacteriota bacterium]